MSIVIDASALVALAVNEPGAEAIASQIDAWSRAGEDLHAPNLVVYEIASAFTMKVARGELEPDHIRRTWEFLPDLRIRFHAPLDNAALVEIAVKLKRSSAYDAAYIALAEQLDAELWTTDGPLKRNAQSRGYPVYLFGDPTNETGKS